MGVRQGESREKADSYFTELADETAVLEPIMSVVMRLFAPPSVADERIAKTSPAAANDLFSTSHPDEAWLAMICRKWDKENRITLKGSPTDRNLAKDMSLGREPSSFLLDLSYRRITLLPIAIEH
jgi:hypothetical protein